MFGWWAKWRDLRCCVHSVFDDADHFLYGLFPPVVECAGLFVQFGYACKSRGQGDCTTRISMSCIDEGTVGNIMLGPVVVEKVVCQGLAKCYSCSNMSNGTLFSEFDEVEPFLVVLFQRVVCGIPLVVPRMDLNRLNILVHANYSQFFGVEP